MVSRNLSPTMHDLLKTSIIQSLEDEKKVNASVRKKITDEINVIDNRLKHLWEYFRSKKHFETSQGLTNACMTSFTIA